MTEPVKILELTKEDRIKLLFKKLDSRMNQFTDIVVNGTLCKMPKVNQIPNKRYYQFKVRLPIGYETTTKYRIRLNGSIYDLYKFDCNFYFIELPQKTVITKELFKAFCTKIQFSFIYYLVYTMLTELTESGVTVELDDYLFHDLTNKFHTPGGQLKLTLSPFSVKNKIMTNDHLYISLFN